MITSRVIAEGDRQLLLIDEDRRESLAYITYCQDEGCFSDFAKAGYKLYSVSAFFGSNVLNENTGLPAFEKGIFDGEKADFSRFDQAVKDILTACPDAMIFPRVNVSPGRKWELEHPDELCYQGSSKYPERKRVCFASELWSEMVENQLSVLIHHVENSSYAEHIIGYQIAGGNTEEWFAFDDRGGKGKCSDAAFAAYVAEGGEDSEESYQRFLSSVVAKRICQFASYIKELTQHRLVVGTFYGYTMEKYNRGGTHHALAELLDCPDVDFICSPISYAQLRKSGRDQPYMLPIHSLKLHGKLYFAENDIRTHLSRPVCEIPAYNGPIWFGPAPEQTLEILKMHFAKALINGHALWWFDMWGGWYQDPRYMAFMEQAKKLMDAVNDECKQIAEVAVVVDEAAPSYLDDKDPGLRSVLFDFREVLGKTAVPLHWYLASDFHEIRDQYKAFVLLKPTETEWSKIIESSGAAVLSVTPENCAMTGEDLRRFCRSAGVHVYSDRDAVVYANQNYLFLHTVEAGEQMLDLQENTVLKDCFTGEQFGRTFQSEAGKSYLFSI